MKTLIYNKKQLEQMLKDKNKYNDMGRNGNILFRSDIDFINKQFPELPEEGLLVGKVGSLAYKLSDGSGYGFSFGRQSNYLLSKDWGFDVDGYWKPATPEQEKKFIEMLKKECESRGLYEDTKIECHAGSDLKAGNAGHFGVLKNSVFIDNNNGRIFSKGEFATPLKSNLLDQVTDAVKDIADFTIEESPTGLIILTPIKK